MKNGIAESSKYKYQNKNGQCQANNINASFVLPNACSMKPKGDEEALKMVLLRFGPVAVGLHTAGGFQFYDKGIYESDECSSDIKEGHHGVILVGYGTENGTDYWNVR
jgi:hypothetical protein